MGVPYAEVIGDPIAHSKSPLIHRFWLEKLNLDGDYRSLRVSPDELEEYLASRRTDPDWRGCNVTMPHKERMWRLLGYAAITGRNGAVNCLARGAGGLEGHNFDVDALLRTMPPPPAKGAIVIIGSGGAARAAREALSSERVTLLARNERKARTLRDEDDRYYPLEAAGIALKGAAGIINASPLGMIGMAAMPKSILEGLARAAQGAFVYDMVYDPPVTDLIQRAQTHGMTTVDGLTMLVEQAALSFHRFFEAMAPRENDAGLRELLTR